MPYHLFVSDNFHPQDDSAGWGEGVYETYEEALRLAQGIVDEFLLANAKPGVSAAQLLALYQGFGEDPGIVAVDAPEPSEKFSAWRYAAERSVEICGGGPG